ncbi:MAG: HAD-IIA family hydrolase [Dehalococcoidia bacterium]
MSEAKSLAQIKGFLIDMDGVLYTGNEPMPGARDLISFLRRHEIPFLLLTNNSTLTPAQYVAKLRRLEIDVDEDKILTSAQAVAPYLHKVATPADEIYVIGEEGLLSALRKEGFTLAKSGTQKVRFVVAGLDRHLTYQKLLEASLRIQQGAAFIGCNPDKTLPLENEFVAPGNGAILAALEASTGVSPLIIGKPEHTIFDLAVSRLGINKEETAMISDRVETDIVGGRNAGLITILTLSHVTDQHELSGASTTPDFTFDSVEELYEALQRSCIH